MDARTGDCLLRGQALVENPGGDADQRRAQARAAGRADREGEPVAVDREARRHHAHHPLARLERAHEQVHLAQHRVQMQVEPGESVARAEAEAGREHASVSLRVHRDEVGRMRLGPRPP